MDKKWGDVLHEIGLSILWFVSGYIFFGAVLGWGTQAAINGALINLIVGLVLIVFINMHERVARLFYRVENGENLGPRRMLLLAMVLIPYLCLVLAICRWLLRVSGLWR